MEVTDDEQQDHNTNSFKMQLLARDF